MKSLLRLYVIGVIAIVCTSTCVAKPVAPTNYVVIGAFSKKSNAIKHVNRANVNEFHAKYEINPLRNLYYVYVLQTDDKVQAITEALRLQKESPYNDTWVFSGMLGEQGSGVDLNPVTQQPVTSVPVNVAPAKDQESVATETPTIAQIPVPDLESILPSVATDVKATSKDFYFKVYRGDGSKADNAEITVVDLTSLKKEYVFKGNENVTMKTVNQSGDIRFECDLAGFRKAVQIVNFKTPDSTDGVTIENDRIVIPFELVRLKKGDHSILYNVFFYKDAAIMRPESKVDLDGILNMMNENSKYKIRIHGHTNGSAAGKLLEAGEPGNIFSLSGAREGSGSAKKLSEKRATVIQEYLTKAGINASRMSVKAWGGKKPIYDKHHTMASANVRVEVEVVDE